MIRSAPKHDSRCLNAGSSAFAVQPAEASSARPENFVKALVRLPSSATATIQSAYPSRPVGALAP